MISSTAKPADVVDEKKYKMRLVSVNVAKRIFHGNGFFGRINSKIATGITDSVGTMWCAYIFVIVVLYVYITAMRALRGIPRGKPLVAGLPRVSISRS